MSLETQASGEFKKTTLFIIKNIESKEEEIINVII
jgi:hypothetical protein